MVADKNFTDFFELHLEFGSAFRIQQHDFVRSDDYANRELIVWFVDEVSSCAKENGFFLFFCLPNVRQQNRLLFLLKKAHFVMNVDFLVWLVN